MKTASWVIIENNTGKAVCELFNAALVDRVNTKKYTAVAILEYLQKMNTYGAKSIL